MKLKKVFFLITSITLMLFANTAFANESSLSDEEINNKLSSIVSDTDYFLPKLNEVANKEADEISEISTYNGTILKTEIRNLEIDDNLSIVNTRTYSTNGSTHTIEDSYGLFWGGIAGAGGTLTAQYTYSHPQIDSPNHMTTKFEQATGYAEDLDEKHYKLSRIKPRWDTSASYSPSADITFTLQTKAGLVWQTVTYKHTCTFDSYGVSKMSWFN